MNSDFQNQTDTGSFLLHHQPKKSEDNVLSCFPYLTGNRYRFLLVLPEKSAKDKDSEPWRKEFKDLRLDPKESESK